MGGKSLICKGEIRNEADVDLATWYFFEYIIIRQQYLIYLKQL